VSQSPEIPERELRERCGEILKLAAEEARKLGHDYIGTEHIFIALTRDEQGVTNRALRRAQLNPRDVRQEIRKEIGRGESLLSQVLPMTPRTEMVLSLAIFLADQDSDTEITARQVLMALLQEGEGLPIRKLVEMGFDVNQCLQSLITEEHESLDISSDDDLLDDLFDDDLDDDNLDSNADNGDNDSGNTNPFTRSNNSFPPFSTRFGSVPPPSSRPFGASREPLKSFISNQTPLINRYGRDLVEQAKLGKIGPAISRDNEIRAIARTLARSKKNNPLLLGDAGVGKTAVVEGLAYQIYAGTAPPSLMNKRVIQLEISALVAGTSLRGQFEERLINIINEARNNGNCILFIDEIHTIVGAGDTIDSNLDAANILKPVLARGEIKCIGATTHEEYRRAIAKDPALDRRFRTIDIEEPNEADSVEILLGQRQKLEEHHGVVIHTETIAAAVKLSIRYMPDRRLPDKALDLLDEACTRVIIRSIPPEMDEAPNDVQVSDVTAVLSEWTGIPVHELTTNERRRLTSLEDALRSRVIGQDQAVDAVASAIKTARAGLSDPNKPIGVFLFLGPSGVGKTELAQTLASYLFSSEDSILRLDMSEFHDAHTVARLIGSPPGYKDNARGGQLTDGLRRRPYSIVLLDEVEKAAPEIFDIFLQVFDEGRISDANGRVVDARHAIFIMTSNIGTQEAGKRLGFGGKSEQSGDYSGYLNQFFRPEFLNRIDEVITFKPLDKETLTAILELQLTALYDRLREQNIQLTLNEGARNLLLREGHTPDSGARPLKRAIERLLTRPLSAKILADEFPKGSHIIVDAHDNALTFEAVTA
jgi:ATP-dependent Clp protease ATP-binding subunit ClpA